MTGDVWTPPSVGRDVLSALSEDDRYRRFDELQGRMGEVWDAMRLNHDDESVVVVPSITLDRAVAASGSLTQAYEERFLFLLVLLRQPRLRMVYVTSMPIAPEITEYYLALLPGVIPSHARARLSLVSVNDSSPRSLSEKLLERPRVLRRIADLIPNRRRSHLVPYNTTELERDVAISLGIPMYGADPRLADLGSKTGCRRLFATVGVPYPLGAEGLHSMDHVADALVSMRAERPAIRTAIVKLNEGVSGAGNAVVRLSGLPSPGAADERDSIVRRLAEMELESPDTPLEVYVAKFAEGGGIVEERVEGDEIRSPSVQLRVLPDGDVELLSTHDQLLGGASGQSYLGCVFPAAPEYARAITKHAEAIGAELAKQGALGRFAVDFVVVRDRSGWMPFAIELNLRKGGTTHPFLTLQFLTDGRYDPSTALFITPRGNEKHLVATDHLETGLPRPRAGRPVRHRREAWPAVRPVPAGGSRLPHDQQPDRARPRRAHRGGRLARRGEQAVPGGRAHPVGGGAAGPSRSRRFPRDRWNTSGTSRTARTSDSRGSGATCAAVAPTADHPTIRAAGTRATRAVSWAWRFQAAWSSRASLASGVAGWLSTTCMAPAPSPVAPTSSRHRSSPTWRRRRRGVRPAEHSRLNWRRRCPPSRSCTRWAPGALMAFAGAVWQARFW
jgi:hypothetical protein